MMDFSESIKKELSQELKEKNVLHRDRFKDIFRARYLELMPSLIRYKNHETVAVDFMKLEVALRSGYGVVIGEAYAPQKNNIQVLGYITSDKTTTNPSDLFETRSLNKKDIHFTIPKSKMLQHYKEITNHDSCQTGNFVVLRNKTLQYISDLNILNHYIDELAEIVLSRFSISMQVKISTLFQGEPGDETLNQIISDIYNGSPYIKATQFFDPEEHIHKIDTVGMAENFQELKREYQNKISELNNMLGINSLAVEKESGVSDAEANSNTGFTTSNANIYLDGRNDGLEKLNKRYGLELKALYNDEVASEFREIAKSDEDNNNEGGDNNANTDTV